MEKLKKYITIDRIIMVLLFIIILFIVFSGNNSINTNKEEINKLKNENKAIIGINDSLKLANVRLLGKMDSIEVEISKINTNIILNKKEIDRLKYEKNKKISIIRNLDPNGVAGGISEYLNKR